MPMTMKTTKEGDVNNMAMYVVIRVKKKAKISIEEGRKAYMKFLSNPDVAIFKDEIDLMLLADGYDEVIVEL